MLVKVRSVGYSSVWVFPGTELKKVTSPDPLYTVKRQRVEQLKQKAKIGVLSSLDASEVDLDQPIKPAKLVYFDSTDLHLCPEVGNTYQATGEQLKVETPADLPTLSEAVVHWFEKLSFAQFCSLMGISDTLSSNL